MLITAVVVIAGSILIGVLFELAAWLVVLQVTGTVLWLSTFGYVLSLIFAKRPAKAAPANPPGGLPKIAVVIPVRNEVGLIVGKLRNLLETTYPRELLHIIIADGGSTDGTLDISNACRELHPWLDVLSVPYSQSRSDQLKHVLERFDCEYAVLTDADGLLAPDCITHLVNELLGDSSIAVLGAQIEPLTRLWEEKLHWWFLNRLWRLEGDVLNSSMVSGVCYACRPALLPSLPENVSADDVFFTLNTSLKGHAAKLSAKARAYELRAPNDIRQMLEFRRRRGSGYLKELKRSLGRILRSLPGSWAALIRLWHFQVTPVLLATFGLASLITLFSNQWPWVAGMAMGIFLPYLVLLWRFKLSNDEKITWPRLIAAGIRLVLINVISACSLPEAKPRDLPSTVEVES